VTDTAIRGSDVLTRQQQCQCGATFEQRGVRIQMNDRSMELGWSPKSCPECESRAAATDQEARQQASASFFAERRRRAEMSLGIPPLYAEASLDTFQSHGTDEQRAQLGKVRHLAANYLGSWSDTPEHLPEHRQLLLFQGHSGSGKGHISWAIARWVVQQYAAEVRVVKLAAIIRDLREAWRDPAGPSEDQRLAAYRRLDLLVIDEVSRHAFYGKEVKQHLYDIVDYRLEQQRPTILTTNEDDDGIGEILGPALMSRLQGAGGIVTFPAVDWRSRERA
jgi:DNA replication protein DnaC